MRISDVLVDFPYKPYELQINYMKSVIDSCENKKYALLESPTGTGKTLSLLCSVLSWKRKIQSIENGNSVNSPQIIYSSRTHSQLGNVINELKKTIFHPTVSQIAARSHLCLIDNVKQSKGDVSTQSNKCRDLRKAKRCEYADDERILIVSQQLLEPLFDIEEFVSVCKSLGACPYFVSQKLAEKSELILTPYTYIVDPVIRSNLPSTLFHNNILIVDEAHNFPDQCCDYFSITLNIRIFDIVRETLNKMGGPEFADFVRGSVNFDIESLDSACERLSKLFNSLNQLIKDFPNQLNANCFQKNAIFWYDLLEKSEIQASNIRGLVRLLYNIKESQVSFDITDITPFDLSWRFFKTLFPFDSKNPNFIDDHYAICLTTDGEFHIFCFSPAIAFNQIRDLQPRTVILTSGTISPFDTFMNSFKFKFPIVLENPHIANPDNLFITIAPRGIYGNKLYFTYQNRNNQQMKEDLAVSLSEAMKIVPGGFLVFFPSFSFMEEIEPILRRKNESTKRIISEPRDQRFLKTAMNSFKDSAKSGAALFAVCRGKISEGIDFSDDFARCVCVVGIPFPNLNDTKVKMHKSWLEGKKSGSGSRWYTEMAIRAVNQAIGRAIRHKDDYAAIILLDQRFEGFYHMISKWIRPSIIIYENWEEIQRNIISFFERHKDTSAEIIPDINVTNFLSDEETYFEFTPQANKKGNSSDENTEKDKSVVNKIKSVRFVDSSSPNSSQSYKSSLKESSSSSPFSFSTSSSKDSIALSSTYSSSQKHSNENTVLTEQAQHSSISSSRKSSSSSTAISQFSQKYVSSSSMSNQEDEPNNNVKKIDQTLEFNSLIYSSLNDKSSTSSSSLTKKHSDSSSSSSSFIQYAQKMIISPIQFAQMPLPSTQTQSETQSIQTEDVKVIPQKSVTYKNQQNLGYDDTKEPNPYDFFTRSQMAIIQPKVPQNKIAAEQIKVNVDKEERKLLCEVLRSFKKTKDIEVLKNGFKELQSEECKKILYNTMSDQLKKILGSDI